eukprot:43599_1
MTSQSFVITLLSIFQFCYGAWQIMDYDPMANTGAIVTTSKARFTVLTPNLIRCEYDPNSKFENRQSAAILNRKTSVPQFTNSSSNGILTIKTSDLTLTYTEGQDFTPSSLQITGNVNGFKFTYKPSGSGPNMDNAISRNLLGTIRTLDGVGSPLTLNCSQLLQQKKGYLHCTWAVFGRNGYALINDTTTAMLDTNWLSHTNNQNIHDWYFFGHGLSYKQALKDFSLISGKHSIVPRYALGSWHSRW